MNEQPPVKTAAPGPRPATERGALMAAVVGALALAGVAWTFRSGPWSALTMTLVMAGFYGWGLLELRRYSSATQALLQGLAAASAGVPDFPAWLATLPSPLQALVQRRADGERGGAVAPALAPYLTGLLVLLGMLGTFLGMVLTFTGTSQALQAGGDVQALRGALAGPVQGLGLAFGTSVAGVAASAMLGLVSALSRRRRAEALQALDRALAGPLQPHTRAHRQQALQAAMEAQAALLPGVARQLSELMAQLAAQQQAWQAQSLDSQQQFHDRAGQALGALAQSVEGSLQRSLEAGAREGAALLKPAVEQALDGMARATADWQARVGGQAEAQMQTLHERFERTAEAVSAQWRAAAAEQQQGAQQTQAALDRATAATVASLQSASGALLQAVHGASRESVEALNGAAVQTAQVLQGSVQSTVERLEGQSTAVLAALQQAAQATVQSLQGVGVETVEAVQGATRAAVGSLAGAASATSTLVNQQAQASAEALLRASADAVAALQASQLASVEALGGAAGRAAQALEASAAAAAGVVEQRSVQAVQALDAAAHATAAALARSTDTAAETLNEQARAVMQGLGDAATGLTAGVEQRLQHWLAALADQQAAQQRAMAEAAASLSEQAGRLQGELGREVSVQLRGLAEGVAGQLDALAGGVGRQLEAVADRFAATAERLSEDGQAAQQQWASQAQAQTTEQRAALAAFSDRFGAQALDLIGEVGATQTRWLDAAAEREQARFVAWTEALRGLGEDLRQRWTEAGAQAQSQQQQIADALADTARRMAADNEAQARRMVDDIAELMEAAAEAPRAAAQVIDGLRAQWAASAERDQALLDERGQALDGLRALLSTAEASAAQQQEAVHGLVASAEAMLVRVGERFAEQAQGTAAGLGDAAAQVAAGSVEVASLGDVFAAAVARFGDSSAALIGQLQRIEQALVQAQARSDDQMAYVVAQAREVVDLTVMQQKQLLDEWQQRSNRAAVREPIDG